MVGHLLKSAAGMFGITAAKAPSKKTGPPADSAPSDFGLPASSFPGARQDYEYHQRLWTPQEAESILAGAESGDLTQQHILFNGMMDTWAPLMCNVRTVADAVKAAPWELKPFETGGKVSSSAQMKRDLVWHAWKSMAGDPAAQELDRDGILTALARGVLGGHRLTEILWHPDLQSWEGGQAWLPRTALTTGPRYYGYQGKSRFLQYRPNGTGALTKFPDHKFLIQVAPAHDGHPATAALIRPLNKYWMGDVYGWEWLVTFTQRYGVPFRWVTYKAPNIALRNQLLEMLAYEGIAGYGAFPEGTKREVQDASKSGEALPQATLLKLARQACDLVIRGETSSSGNEESKGFSKGDVQEGVRRDTMQGYCNTIVRTLNQFARIICEVNFGTCDECPEWMCEIPEPEDAAQNATRDSTLISAGVPIKLEQLWERHDLIPPANGDRVLVGNRMVEWNDETLIEKPAGPLTAPPPDAGGMTKPEGQNPKEARNPKASLTAAKGLPEISLDQDPALVTPNFIEAFLLTGLNAGVDQFKEDTAEETQT